MTFTSIDYDKFRALRVTHVATRLEELIQDEANDTLTPEQLFLTAVDDALEEGLEQQVGAGLFVRELLGPGVAVGAEVDLERFQELRHLQAAIGADVPRGLLR